MEEPLEEFAFIKASALTDNHALNADMQDWGKIQDVIIGIAPNAFDYTILDLDQELLDGLDEDALTLIPLSALNFSAAEDVLFLDASITAEVILSAPVVTEEALHNIGHPTWDDDLATYWEVAGVMEPDVAGTEEMAAVRPAFIRISQLTGESSRIINPADEVFGKLTDIIVGLRPNAPDYAIVSPGDFTDIREEVYVVPLNRMDFTQLAEGKIILEVDPATLQQAPIFDETVFPGVAADIYWNDELADFWGIEEAPAAVR